MIVNCKEIKEEILNSIKNTISTNNYKLKVIDIIIGDSKENILYAKNKEKSASMVGIDFQLVKFTSNDTEEDIIAFIKEKNKDKTITGIMVSLPIDKNFNQDRIINSIDTNKDIDCLTDTNRLKLYNDNSPIIPPTVASILKIVSYLNISLNNKNVVIIGRGELVGKPLIPVLLRTNANVTICHSKTTNLEKYLKNADIVISATNKENIITKDMVSSNLVIIDAGTIYKDNKLYGNVMKDVYDIVKYITPVPNGVGQVTTAMFLKNILTCYEIKNLLK